MVLLKLLQINPGAQIDDIIKKLDILSNQIDSKSSALPQGFESIQKPFANKHLPEKQETQAVKESMPTSGYQATMPPPAMQSHKDSPTTTWQDFLNKIEPILPYMFTLLSKGHVINKAEKIIVELENGSSFDKTRLKKTKPELQKICKEFLGKQLTINMISQNKKLTQNEPDKDDHKARQAAFNHPLVIEAQKMFDGEIINY